MKTLLLLFGGLLCSSTSFSQLQITRDVFASSGSEMSNGTVEISFTMGETFTSTFDPDATHTLGFQQGDLNFVSVHELPNEVITVFPNPANEQITFTSSSEAPFMYRVHDVAGRIVRLGRSIDGVLTLNVTGIEPGKYFLEYIPESGQTQYLPFIKIL